MWEVTVLATIFGQVNLKLQKKKVVLNQISINFCLIFLGEWASACFHPCIQFTCTL